MKTAFTAGTRDASVNGAMLPRAGCVNTCAPFVLWDSMPVASEYIFTYFTMRGARSTCNTRVEVPEIKIMFAICAC